MAALLASFMQGNTCRLQADSFKLTELLGESRSPRRWGVIHCKDGYMLWITYQTLNQLGERKMFSKRTTDPHWASEGDPSIKAGEGILPKHPAAIFARKDGFSQNSVSFRVIVVVLEQSDFMFLFRKSLKQIYSSKNLWRDICFQVSCSSLAQIAGSLVSPNCSLHLSPRILLHPALREPSTSPTPTTPLFRKRSFASSRRWDILWAGKPPEKSGTSTCPWQWNFNFLNALRMLRLSCSYHLQAVERVPHRQSSNRLSCGFLVSESQDYKTMVQVCVIICYGRSRQRIHSDRHDFCTAPTLFFHWKQMLLHHAPHISFTCRCLRNSTAGCLWPAARDPRIVFNGFSTCRVQALFVANLLDLLV